MVEDAGPFLKWPIIELSELLGFPVEVARSVDSTNSVLMRRVQQKSLRTPWLLAAEEQTSGRGRREHTWQTGIPGRFASALAFSLAMPISGADFSGLSLAVGLAAARVLHNDIWLKWPNDLWLWDGAQGRKLAGILIETCLAPAPDPQRMCIIGMGLNIEPLPPDSFATAPAALTELRPDLNAARALALIAPAIAGAVHTFEREGFAPFVRDFAARHLLTGLEVLCSNGAQGVCLGVAANGALRLLQRGGGELLVYSGEVSVRPKIAQTH